jgi:hypothetical protein
MVNRRWAVFRLWTTDVSCLLLTELLLPYLFLANLALDRWRCRCRGATI